MTRYNKISEVPSYAQPTIIKMVDGGFIDGAGTSKGFNGLNDIIFYNRIII